jgi:hypothetical protein
MIHGSSLLCISCAKNTRAKRGRHGQRNFKVSATCDKEFHQMAQTFGMTAEYPRLKGDTDRNVLPDIG